MARPKKDWKIQRNGESVRFFKDGVYLGSLSLRFLEQNLKSKPGIDTAGVLVQGCHEEISKLKATSDTILKELL